jgi:hypothetical protein
MRIHLSFRLIGGLTIATATTMGCAQLLGDDLPLASSDAGTSSDTGTGDAGAETGDSDTGTADADGECRTIVAKKIYLGGAPPDVITVGDGFLAIAGSLHPSLQPQLLFFPFGGGEPRIVMDLSSRPIHGLHLADETAFVAFDLVIRKFALADASSTELAWYDTSTDPPGGIHPAVFGGGWVYWAWNSRRLTSFVPESMARASRACPSHRDDRRRSSSTPEVPRGSIARPTHSCISRTIRSPRRTSESTVRRRTRSPWTTR